MAVILSAMAVSGCETDTIKPAPRNISQYSQMGRADRTRYNPVFIINYNIAIIQNNESPLKEREDSLALVEKLVRDGYELTGSQLDDLASQLQDKASPPELAQKVLVFLLSQNYSDMAAHVIPLMRKMQTDPELRKLVVNWLKKNPMPEMLGSVIKSWASEQNITKASEQSYRDTVQELTARTWDAALLDAINTPGFTAQGDALAILVSRMKTSELRSRILALSPRTDAVKAMQVFIDQFDYLPATAPEFAAEIVIYKLRRDLIADAARLCIQWCRAYGYKFDIRDFHLLSRLARDPLRSNLNRTQLILKIGDELKLKRHYKHVPSDADRHDRYDESFWGQVDRLSMADLWNIYLLIEMFSRPRDQVNWWLFAEGDLKDINSAWGGLIFYRNGQGEAYLYLNPDAGDDISYIPTSRTLTDARDAMCRYVCHFEKVQNAERSGPTAQELSDAKQMDFYGVVLTRIDTKNFCVHYYNPEGVVVSLGTYPFRQGK
ncbi:MAG TPA: hypothetical protein PKK48_01410 [Phycisphaerae bacterium]|nr:hypothetical protein [Phycisphaerae bacterium]